MKVVILHDELSPDARPDEMDAIVQANCVAAALAELGHTSVAMGCTLNLQELAQRLRGLKPDCVFNLVESLAGHGRLVHLVPALLDSLAIPYTGAGTQAMFITAGKTLCKQILQAHGIATPRWFTPESLAAGDPPSDHEPFAAEELPCGTGFQPVQFRDCGTGSSFMPGRYIIKSVWEEASVGLEDDSVREFTSAAELLAELTVRRHRLGGSAFAESYIEGREFNLSVITGGDVGRVLPPAEIQFIGFAPDKPRIVGYSAKWREDTHEFHNTPRTFEFPQEDRTLLHELMDIALRCWRVLGLRGYARVDFRVDQQGRPLVLEVNANPCLSPDAGFAAATARAGLSFPQVVDRLLRDAAA